MTDIENERLKLQEELDSRKTGAERNKLGQFATPTALARHIVGHGVALLQGEPIRFLDPAIGTGSFFSALGTVAEASTIESAVGYEVDPHYGEPARKLWADTGLKLELADFTAASPRPAFNLVICNPPYVRHHHLAQKDKVFLQQAAAAASGVKIGGLAGLYCYFLGIAHGWMTDGGVAGWLIPSEFMDVNYGRRVREYLLERVTLLQIHRFDPNDVQFADALVSSAIVWFRKAPPPRGHSVLFTYGGTQEEPKYSRTVSVEDLRREGKWTRFPKSGVRAENSEPTVGDFFKIKRGIATGDNGFFILNEEQVNELAIPSKHLRPILPSPRYLTVDEIEADADGIPCLDRRLFLLDPQASEEVLKAESPRVWEYLQQGKAKGLHERYLCRQRRLWYTQEVRPAAPIVCTYLGRGDKKNGRPFRFIRNRSRATVANVYLAMYPTARLEAALATDPSLLDRAWGMLNMIPADTLLGEGRVYGGGLYKLEPRELAKVPFPILAEHAPEQNAQKQLELIC